MVSTETTNAPGAQARRALGRAFAAAVVAGLVVAACGSGGSSTGLPECAGDLPLPDGVSVVEVTATPRADSPTCAMTLASGAPVDDVVASWRTTLDDAGIDYSERHQPGQQAVLRLEGPVCGSVLVFAAGTERVTDAVDPDRTPVLASVTDCAAG